MRLQDQRIVVTGGHGFLGQHTVRSLQERGCTVATFHSDEYDLTDRGMVWRILKDLQPTLVFHLAARVGGIGANRATPATFFYDNLVMGAHLIEEAHQAGVSKVVLVGTVCAYPKHTPVPFREDDLWNGYPEETNAPYGIAKKALLVQAQAYRQQYGMNIITLFPVNLYGPGDNFDLDTSHVIPAIIRKVQIAMDAGEDEVTLWGDGTPTREFLYAPDCAEGLVLAAEKYDDGDPVNLGTGQEISIADVARKIGDIMEFQGEFVFDTTKPNGQPRRCMDVTRAKERFGFEAKTSLEDGLRETIAWWRR